MGYKLMQAFSISNGLGTAELEGMLDLVAVSIAADIVPMVDENRVMAYHGLKRLNSNPNMGLRAIIRTCGLGGKEITISDVIFKIGPRINASGRMQSGREAVELLVSRDLKEANKRVWPSTSTTKTERNSTNASPRRPMQSLQHVAKWTRTKSRL